MASARKRSPKDKRFVAYYTDRAGVRRQKMGFESKAATEQLARKLEDEERKIREGLVNPAEETRKDADRKPIAAHIEEYRKILEAKGNDPKHCAATASALKRLLAATPARSVGEITTDHILLALKSWKDRKRSARTLNHALGAVKAFCRWLADAERIARVPMGLLKLEKFNEAEDRRKVRRALTKEQVARLLAAAENGPTLTREAPKVPREKGSGRGGWGQKGRARKVPITGLQRATLYRLAMATGFRANELRSLTKESFRLDGDDPCIVLEASAEKAGRGVVQPIRRDMAAILRPLVEAAEPGRPFVPVPEKTAKLLRMDLEAAGIPHADEDGEIDFHALRSTYVTHLIEDGMDIREAQILARHSTPVLTIGIYTKKSRSKLRDALEGGK